MDKNRLVDLAKAYVEDKLYYYVNGGGVKKFNTHNLPKVTLKIFLEKYLTEEEAKLSNPKFAALTIEELEKENKALKNQICKLNDELSCFRFTKI